MIVLDGIVVLLALVLNPIARRRRRKAEGDARSEESRIGTPSEETTRVDNSTDEVDERGEKIAKVLPMPDLHVHPDVRNHDLHHHLGDLAGRTPDGARTEQ